MSEKSKGEIWEKYKQIVAFWLTACWDMARSDKKGCRKCPIKRQCRQARTELWGHDILALKEYLLEISPNFSSKKEEVKKGVGKTP